MNFSARQLDPWAAALAITTLLFPPIAALGMRWVGPWPIIGGLIVVLLLRVVLPAAAPVPVEMTLCLLAVAGRSEEHTSELQSLMRISYAVFCLKQKKKKNQHTNNQ